MVARTKLILLGSCLTIAALFAMPLVPQAISQASQPNGAPLRDVCQEGWSRYDCVQPGVRLCVSPDVQGQYDLAKSPGVSGGCRLDTNLVPEPWMHATPEEVGYVYAEAGTGYHFYVRSAKLDSSVIKGGDLERAISKLLMLTESEMEAWGHGQAKWKPAAPISLEQYKLDPPTPEAGATDVCPAAWSRFSCQFVRLCVSPSVAGHYDLTTSEEFGYAKCKADDRIVPEKDTYCSPKRDMHCSPHDVGLAAGMLILGPRYLKAVKLDSSDIFDGNIEEAIQRLVLVPIPTSGLMEYDRGYEEGQAAFQKYLTENGQKDTKSPH